MPKKTQPEALKEAVHEAAEKKTNVVVHGELDSPESQAIAKAAAEDLGVEVVILPQRLAEIRAYAEGHPTKNVHLNESCLEIRQQDFRFLLQVIDELMAAQRS